MQTSPPLGAIDDVELEFKKGGQNLGPSPIKNGVPSNRKVIMSFGGAKALKIYNKPLSL